MEKVRCHRHLQSRGREKSLRTKIRNSLLGHSSRDISSYKAVAWKHVGVFNEPLLVGKTPVVILKLLAGVSECDPKGFALSFFSFPFPFFFLPLLVRSLSHKHMRAPATNNSLTGSLTSIQYCSLASNSVAATVH